MAFTQILLPTNHLLSLLPIIEEHVPAQIAGPLAIKLKAAVDDENSPTNGKLLALVKYVCAQRPSEFGEWLVYYMLAMAVTVTKFGGCVHMVRSLKQDLEFHVAHTPIPDDYCTDFKKIYVMAESMWSITSDIPNLNHIIFRIHDSDRFTYNVCMALLCGAFNQLTTDEPVSFALRDLNDVFTSIAATDVKTADSQTITKLLHFLLLFQTFQSAFWFNHDHPKLHPDLNAYMDCDIKIVAKLRLLLVDLDQHVNKAIRDGTVEPNQIMMNQIIDIVIRDLDKMTLQLTEVDA